MPFISLTEADAAAMLGELGLKDLDALFAHIPADLRGHAFALPPGRTQLEVERELEDLAARNQRAAEGVCFLGAGAYDHHVPAALREILRRGELYTAYTPYQPEIAQGMLQALFEYQTMVARLTGLDVANASLYDGATACLEALGLAVRHTNRTRVVVDANLNPRWREVIRTGAAGMGIAVVEVAGGDLGRGRDGAALAAAVDASTAALLVPNPDFFGRYADCKALAEAVHARGALLIGAAAPLSMAIFEPPGAMGCDVACGEGQELGLGLNFGGPYLGFLAARKELVRRMPGRLVGMTVDSRGRRVFTLTLQTREQHIRREKATSNICSNQSLCAFAAGLYLALMGREGIRRCALACLGGIAALRAKLAAIPGVALFPGVHWRECVVRTPLPAERLCELLAAKGILAGVPLAARFGTGPWQAGDVLVAVTEKRTAAELESYAAALREAVSAAR